MKKRRTLIVSLLLVAAMVMGIGYAALTSTLTINGTASLNNAVGDGGGGGTTTDPKQMQVYFTAAAVHDTNVQVPNSNGTLDKAPIDSDLGTVAVGGASNSEDGGKTASGTAISASYHAKGLRQAGDSVTFKFTVTNMSTDVDAYLQKIVVNTANAKLYNVTTGSRVDMPENYDDYFTTSCSVGGSTVTFGEDLGTAHKIDMGGTNTLDVYVTLTLTKTLGSTVGSTVVPAAIEMESSVITLTFDDNNP